jgi:hypothetical protein
LAATACVLSIPSARSDPAHGVILSKCNCSSSYGACFSWYDAEEERQSIPDYLADGDGLQEYLAELNRYCLKQIARAQQQPMILAVAELVRSHQAVLSGEALDTAKYQVMLDNDLYKALKALREAQASRGNVTNGFVLENAAAEQGQFAESVGCTPSSMRSV